MGLGEVVTVQLGNVASHAGAHFWNIQDEAAGVEHEHAANGTSMRGVGAGIASPGVDANVMYAETVSGYRPRLLAIDFRGCFGSFETHVGGRQRLGMSDGDVLAQEQIVANWDGRVDVSRGERAERSDFLQLLDRYEEEEEEDGVCAAKENSEPNDGVVANETDDDADDDAERNRELYDSVASLEGNVKYWTDYLKVDLPPRSLFEIPLNLDPSVDLDGFGSGCEAILAAGAAGREALEEIDDRVRCLVEECDMMQGMHFFADDWGGYAGIVATVLSELRDQYESRPLFLFGLRQPRAKTDILNGTPYTALNDALSIAKLYGESTIALPLHLPEHSLSTKYYQFQPAQQYHLGALAGAVADTASLPYRCPRGSGEQHGLSGMSDYADVMHGSGGPIVSASCAFPAELLPDESDVDGRGISRATDLRMAETSHTHLRESLLSEMSGLPWAYNASDRKTPRMRAEISILRGARMQCGKTASQSYALDCVQHTIMQRPHCVRRFGAFDSPLYVPSSYPRVFRDIVGRHGERLPSDQPYRRIGDVRSSSMMMHLTVMPSFSKAIEAATTKFERASRGAAGRAALQSWGMSHDDISEATEKLQEMALSYRDANEGDSCLDSDSDDWDSD